MLSSNLALLYLLPISLALIGIYILAKGSLKRDFTIFKFGFYFFLGGFVSTAFIFLVGQSSTRTNVLSSDLDTAFLISFSILAVVSLLGIIYYTFNNFLPVFFIRMALFLSVFSVIAGSVSTYRHATQKSTSKNFKSGFVEVEQPKMNSQVPSIQ